MAHGVKWRLVEPVEARGVKRREWSIVEAHGLKWRLMEPTGG